MDTFLKKFNTNKHKIADHQSFKKILTLDKWKINEHLEKHLKTLFNSELDIRIITQMSDNYAISLSPDDIVPDFFKNEISKVDYSKSGSYYTLFTKFFSPTDCNIFHIFADFQDLERYNNADTLQIVIPIDTFISSINFSLYISMYALYEKGELTYNFNSTKNLNTLNKQKTVVIYLLDNGRSNLLKNPSTRDLFDLGWFDYPEFLPKISKNLAQLREYNINGYIPFFETIHFTPLINQFCPLAVNLLKHQFTYTMEDYKQKNVVKNWESIKNKITFSKKDKNHSELSPMLIDKIIK